MPKTDPAVWEEKEVPKFVDSGDLFLSPVRAGVWSAGIHGCYCLL